MTVDVGAIAKVLGGGMTGAGLVASGSGIAHSLREEKTEYREVDVKVEQNQLEDEAKDRYTFLRIHGKRQMFVEMSHHGDGQKKYIYDHVHEKENVPYIYYLKNTDGDNIRISYDKPQGERKGIYKGWILSEFVWEENKDKKWYGYCPPKDSPQENKLCEKLAVGWSRKEIIDNPKE